MALNIGWQVNQKVGDIIMIPSHLSSRNYHRGQGFQVIVETPEATT
jgi:hypothetical protein